VARVALINGSERAVDVAEMGWIKNRGADGVVEKDV
jgi:hypothetical protein